MDSRGRGADARLAAAITIAAAVSMGLWAAVLMVATIAHAQQRSSARGVLTIASHGIASGVTPPPPRCPVPDPQVGGRACQPVRTDGVRWAGAQRAGRGARRSEPRSRT